MKTKLQNQKARDQLASLMRALYTNRITNLEFDERAEEYAFDDHAAFQVFWLGAWRTYDDFGEQRFTGERALTREGKRTVARWILFLKSGQPYAWPESPSLPQWFFWPSLLTPIPVALCFGRWDVMGVGFIAALFFLWALDRRYTQWKRPDFEKSGDFEVWPFISKADYEVALKNPPYLCGDRRS